MKLYIEDNQTLPAVQVLQDADPAPVGFTESNTIDDWYKYGSRVLDQYYGFNYLVWRSKILSLVVAIVDPTYVNWDNLTVEQKEIAVKMILAPYALRMLVVNDQTDSINWNYLIQRSQGLPVQTYDGRAMVVEQMREAVGNEYRVETMSKDHVDLFDQDTHDLIGFYIRSNSPNFKQWLINEVGTPYENAGFADTAYYSVERKDYLLEIYNGGY